MDLISEILDYVAANQHERTVGSKSWTFITYEELKKNLCSDDITSHMLQGALKTCMKEHLVRYENPHKEDHPKFIRIKCVSTPDNYDV